MHAFRWNNRLEDVGDFEQAWRLQEVPSAVAVRRPKFLCAASAPAVGAGAGKAMSVLALRGILCRSVAPVRAGARVSGIAPRPRQDGFPGSEPDGRGEIPAPGSTAASATAGTPGAAARGTCIWFSPRACTAVPQPGRGREAAPARGVSRGT